MLKNSKLFSGYFVFSIFLCSLMYFKINSLNNELDILRSEEIKKSLLITDLEEKVKKYESRSIKETREKVNSLVNKSISEEKHKSKNNHNINTQTENLDHDVVSKKQNSFNDGLETQRRISAIINYHKDKKGLLSDEFSNIFDNETVDYEWAEENESKLRKFFDEEKQLDAFALKDSECKSNLCRLTIYTLDLDESQRLSSTFSDVFSLKENGMSDYQFFSIPSNGEGVTEIYIGRSEGFDFLDKI